MDFKNAKELLELCQKQNLPISEIMLRREMTEGEMPEEEASRRMARALAIMKESVHTPIQTPVRSMGGLIGGEAGKLASHQAAGRGICGDVLEKAITYAVAVLETNASMGLIVAAPTAGSAGVVPGMLLALQECHSFSDNDLIKALFNAGGAVQNYIVKYQTQFICQFAHLLRRYGTLISCLRRRQQIERRIMSVTDQCLPDPTVSLHHVYQIIDNPVFKPHHHIQIPKTDICIDQHYFFIHAGETRTYIGS